MIIDVLAFLKSSTQNHPFYVMDKGRVAAGDLENGDEYGYDKGVRFYGDSQALVVFLNSFKNELSAILI